MAIEWKVKGIYKANAQAVYDEIQQIGDTYTPEQIVEKATDESTELHKCFEWDDSAAAHKYRLSQAQGIVRCLVLVNEKVEDKELPKVRAIVSTNMRENTYEPVKITIRKVDSYERLKAEALRELEAFRKKYAVIEEIGDIIDELEAVIAQSA
jgi:hypothetical protein